ncbi:Gfo/Idh/MocA family protein [Abyssalbus ytuae]|uniref:Gfo/Idh/MocA family oxidoreductase n=1 Tax=Abyssalbus ytuae TaxID=2926907 RepID=A0A9E6ZRU0_9FLAO|nr:Gfo/Idh/MocA family oxidoreductase [Abyssalbus ytuae]UOB19310.1 Gfo/Idh/MocA family oxidoreductase [Abyssalbus ytuae]
MIHQKLNEVKWGIIGCGDVCEVKSGPALQQIKNSSITAVMRRNSHKAKDFALRHKVPKWYNNADELINDPEVNAIYIATPPDTHMEYTIKAANAGKPVYVEKPMARNHAECIQMVLACKEKSVPLFIAYYRRALPSILKIKEIIDSGIIGNIRFVNVTLLKSLHPDIVGASNNPDNWRIFPEISGGGYFYDLASHQLDVLDFLLGPVIDATGFAVNQSQIYPAEDLTTGIFRFQNGVLGNGIWSFNTSTTSEEEVTTIVGSKGQISFPFFGNHSVTLKVEEKEDQIFKFNISKHIQQYLLQTIVNELTGEGKCPSNGVSGARTNWVMEQICKRIDK